MSKKNETAVEENIRPKTLNEYIGQERIKDNLKIYIDSANKRNKALDHVLLYGPSGLGKTTLAGIIAYERNVTMHLSSGASIEKPGDLAAILATVEEGDVLFIDEIHRLPKIVEEILYTVMEDFVLSIVLNNSDGVSRNLNLELPPFTLIGATTKGGSISSPLRNRFGIVEKIGFYKVEELKEIIKRTAKLFKMKIDDPASEAIAIRSRGIPRVANRLFKRVFDYSFYINRNYIDSDLVNESMGKLQIDEIGLELIDLEYLLVIKNRFNGGPVGIEAIASAMNEDPVNLIEMVEPYLVLKSLVNRSKRGREITQLGLKHINKILKPK